MFRLIYILIYIKRLLFLKEFPLKSFNTKWILKIRRMNVEFKGTIRLNRNTYILKKN